MKKIKIMKNRFGFVIGILLAVGIFLMGCAGEAAMPTASSSVPTSAPEVPLARTNSNFVLTILHNSDGESKLKNLGSGFENYGGVARFISVVNRERELAALTDGTSIGSGHRGVIMVSSGDNFLAGPVFTVGMRAGIFYDALAIDYIDYDAIALGNHEFDLGPDVLADFIKQVFLTRPPFLSSNLDFFAEPILMELLKDGRIAESVVVVKNGEKIGLIGLTTPLLASISSPRRVKVISDIAREVQTEVDRLEASGVNKIVLLSHLQDIGGEIALVANLHGVDVVVAGGGDELLANECDLLIPDRGTVFGSYPMMATALDGIQVPVVTTAGQYSYLGKLVVTFDSNGNVIEIDEEASGPIRIALGDAQGAIEGSRRSCGADQDAEQRERSARAGARNIPQEVSVDSGGARRHPRGALCRRGGSLRRGRPQPRATGSGRRRTAPKGRLDLRCRRGPGWHGRHSCQR